MVELATKRDLEISFLWLRPLRRWRRGRFTRAEAERIVAGIAGR